MEALSHGAVRSIASILLSCFLQLSLFGAAGYRTANFTVDAPTLQLAQEIGESAEQWRRQLALEWLGRELPNWTQPCPIKAQVAPGLGAGGATSFVFEAGEVFGWRMNIQGSRERILDSVLPHEITHTIFASHFRQPLPRWADEGACTTVEHRSEIAKQESMLIDFLQHNRGIPFDRMFAMTEYPADVLPLYAQGHSLAQFLIYQGGKAEFMAFLEDGLRDDNWPRALQRYNYNDLLVLQNSWLNWVKQGRPALALASATPGNSAVVRGQDPGAQQTAQQHAGSQGNSPRTNPWVSLEAASPVTPTPAAPPPPKNGPLLSNRKKSRLLSRGLSRRSMRRLAGELCVANIR